MIVKKLAPSLILMLLSSSWAGSVKAAETCYAIYVTAVVCVTSGGETTCSETTYLDDFWCTDSGGTGGGTDDGGGGGGGGFEPTPTSNPSDNDTDGIADHWLDVLKTTDPCALNFDTNDRLGSNFGGPNTQRPGHSGVDIQANQGDSVAALRDGTIDFVGWQRESDHGAGCGFHIRVRHDNGDTSVYCHLVGDSNVYEEDFRVRAGTVIGLANSTGNSSGHHLHLKYNSTEAGAPVEYFHQTGTQPSANQLDPNGC